MNVVRVLVVEDDPAISSGLEYYLQGEGFDVYCADSGEKAFKLVETKDPHLLLLDIRLPDISGFDVCRKLRADGRSLPILMLTALDDEADRVLGLELGADDYIVKPYKLREVVARIRASLRRTYGKLSAGRDGRQFIFGDIRVDFETMLVLKAERPVPLTPAEFKLLHKFLAHPERIFTREDLIKVLYGDDDWICDRRTIDVHVLHLRGKLEDNPQEPRWFKTAHGFGYKFVR